MATRALTNWRRHRLGHGRAPRAGGRARERVALTRQSAQRFALLTLQTTAHKLCACLASQILGRRLHVAGFHLLLLQIWYRSRFSALATETITHEALAGIACKLLGPRLCIALLHEVLLAIAC